MRASSVLFGFALLLSLATPWWAAGDAFSPPPPSVDLQIAQKVDSSEVASTPFTVDLGGFTTEAELTYPVSGREFGNGPYPLILLVHGNGPQDMDATIPRSSGATRLFYDLAHWLSARGFAVARYNKRFVSGPGQFDPSFWTEQQTPLFTDDADAVLDKALTLGPADPQRVFVYGWSEGTAVGSLLAARRSDVDGLILQGAVGLPYREMAEAWIAEVAAPYVRSFSASDMITADALEAAAAGPGGSIAKLGAAFLTDPSFNQTGVWAVSQYVDSNGDDMLSEEEIENGLGPVLDFMFSPAGNLYVYAEGRSVPTVTDQANTLSMPTLILQGGSDASTPARGATVLVDALREQGNTDVTVEMYDGLGHTLGIATSVADDVGRPMSRRALTDIVAWLRERTTP